MIVEWIHYKVGMNNQKVNGTKSDSEYNEQKVIVIRAKSDNE